MKQLLTITLLLCAALCAPAAAILNLTGLPTTVDNGVFVGPATANINGGQPFQWNCIDFFLNTPIPSSFYVNITTYIGTSTPVLYKELDYLLRHETPANVGATAWTIWNLVAPAAPDHDGSPAMVAAIQAMDWTNYSANITLYDPKYTLDQRGVSIGKLADVPEPATFGRLGVALFALAMFRKRRSA